MSKNITQDMAYRQSLMQYAEKYGVSRASRKYDKSRSYIYFWKSRWGGSTALLACRSRRPHGHPNQHTEAELKLIRDMHRRNPTLGLPELWYRLREHGYSRHPRNLFRVMRRLGMFPPPEKKAVHKPKPYEQMTRPGQRVQVDVKVVPHHCITDPELCLFQYTAIDEFTRCVSWPLIPSSPPSPPPIFSKGWRGGIVAGVFPSNASRPTTASSLPTARDRSTLFELTASQLGIRHKLIRPYTPRHNGKVGRSHREDQRRFYSCRSFYSLDDFAKQLAIHNRRSNNFPMRPLGWRSPLDFPVQFVRQSYTSFHAVCQRLGLWFAEWFKENDFPTDYLLFLHYL